MNEGEEYNECIAVFLRMIILFVSFMFMVRNMTRWDMLLVMNSPN